MKGDFKTLYKGGRKRKDDPSGSRDNTRSSSIIKVYEMISLERCLHNIHDRLQGGFQEELDCSMTSFAQREILF